MIINFFDYLGYYGPVILWGFTALFLMSFKFYYYLSAFFIGLVLNIGLNAILKNIIKDPRPKSDINFPFSSKKTHRILEDKFGMPSLHSQNVAFATSFIYCVFQNIPTLILFLLLTANTMRQRVKFQNHTIPQVICGLILGLIFGYISYWIARKFKPSIIEGHASHGGGSHGSGHGGGGAYYGHGRGIPSTYYGSGEIYGRRQGNYYNWGYGGNNGWGNGWEFWDMCYDNWGNKFPCA